MAGIYLHIPFCKRACHYCNFHFSTTTKDVEPMVECMMKEIILQNNYTSEDIATIYFGGGTPSILQPQYIDQLLKTIYQQFKVLPDAEITLEANPDDITTERLKAWKAIGINRLSIGIQSFREEDLLWMNRAHNAVQAKECIRLAQQEGIDNITIDLIYGVPNLSDEQWMENIHTALSLNIPHLSCYALTVEPKTALDKMIKQQKKEPVDTDKQAAQFIILMNELKEAGFQHYEISNFAKPGFRSKHNSSYWQGKPYIGIGPSAHSYNGLARQWNIANNALYIQSIHQNTIPSEEELLSADQRYNEFVMISLRTIEGLNLNTLRTLFGEGKLGYTVLAIQRWIEEQYVVEINNSYCLTTTGKLMADAIASDLFIVD